MADTNLTVDVSINTKDAKKELKDLQSELKNAKTEFNNAGKAIDGYTDKYEALNKQLDASVKQQKAYEQTIKGIRKVINAYNDELDKQEQKLKQIEQTHGKTSNEYLKQEEVVAKTRKEITKYTRELNSVISESEVAARQSKSLQNQIDSLCDEAKETAAEFKEMNNNLKKIDWSSVANTINNVGQSIGQMGERIVDFFTDGFTSALEFNAELETTEFLMSQLPSHAQEMINKLGEVSLEFGITENTGKQLATDIASFFNRSGNLDEIDTTALWERVLDLSALYDMDISSVWDHIVGLLMGQSQNSDALGFNASISDLEDKLSLDMAKLSSGEQQLAWYTYLMNETASAIGRASSEAEGGTAQFKLLKQQLEETVNLGFSPLIDACAPLFENLNGVLTPINDWIEKNPELMAGITAVVGALGALMSAAGFVAPILSALILAFGSEKVLSFASSIGSVVAKFGLWGVAIAAVIGVIVLLWNNCEWFREGIINLVNLIKEKITAFVEWITPYFQALCDFLTGLWTTIKENAINIWNSIREFFKSDQTTQTMINAWNIVKDTLITVWNWIKEQALFVWNSLTSFWTEHGESIKIILSHAWEYIKGQLTGAWNNIKSIAETVFGWLKAFWDTWGDDISTNMTNLWEGIQTYLSTVWDIIKELFSTFLDVLGEAFDIFADLLEGDWEGLWENLKELMTGFVEHCKNIVERIVGAFTGIGDKIKAAFGGVFEWISNKIAGAQADAANAGNVPETRSYNLLPQNGMLETRPYNHLLSNIGDTSTLTTRTPYFYGDSYETQHFTTTYNPVAKKGFGSTSAEDIYDMLSKQNELINQQNQLLIQTLNSNNNSNFIIQEMNVRSDNDIRNIARELDTLRRIEGMAKGR